MLCVSGRVEAGEKKLLGVYPVKRERLLGAPRKERTVDEAGLLSWLERRDKSGANIARSEE